MADQFEQSMCMVALKRAKWVWQHTWNLEVMSKCFFVSVPSTWLMHTERTWAIVSDFIMFNCTFTSLLSQMQCVSLATFVHITQHAIAM